MNRERYKKGDELEVRGKDGRYVEVLNLTKARIASAAAAVEREQINGLIGWATGVQIELVEGELERGNSDVWCVTIPSEPDLIGWGESPLEALENAIPNQAVSE